MACRVTLKDCGEVVMPAVFGDFSGPRHPDVRSTLQRIKQNHFGGIAIFGGNAHGCRDLLKAVQSLSKKSEPPLLVAMDMERGVAQHFPDATPFPYALAQVAAASEADIKASAAALAKEARAVGINMIFGPVIDVNVNPDNPIISVRAYGDTVKQVVRWGGLLHDVYVANGLLPVIKHFPGHGDTSIDSHRSMPVITKSLKELERVELAPFKALIKQGAKSLMIGHLAIPALEPKGMRPRPATFSTAVINGLLRGEWGFDGLIVTDALIMEAVGRGRDELEVARSALLAGNDILLYPRRPDRLVDRLARAVQQEAELADAVEAAADRVRSARRKLPRRAPSFSIVGCEAHRRLSNKIQKRAVTLLRGSITSLKKAKSVTLFTAGPGGILPEFKTGWELIAPLEDQNKKVETHPLASHNEVPLGEAVIVACYHAVAGWGERQRITPEERRGIQSLIKKRPVTVVVFGTPYAARDLPSGIAVLLAYDCSPRAERAVGESILSSKGPAGRLPIRLI